MHLVKKTAIVIAIITASFTLSACSGDGAGNNANNPVSVSEGFETDTYELSDGYKVTCITSGFGNYAVLSCVPAQASAKDITPISDSSYEVKYNQFEDGRTMPCLEDGYGDKRVFSCVDQPR